MDMAADMPIFLSDFGVPYVLTRGNVSFDALHGYQDQEVLSGYALGRDIAITYPTTVGLVDGDELTRTSDASRWTVRNPRAVSDGAMSNAQLEARS